MHNQLTLTEYQASARRTVPSDAARTELIANFALGLVCEAGEAGDVIKKHLFHHHGLDRDDLVKELGDVLWYLSNVAGMFDITLEEVAQTNIDKLKKRYPDGFSARDSVSRVDELAGEV